MKEVKKYTSIIRYGKSSTKDVLKKGDIISITEKLDGANSSFVKDDDNFLGVSCYSRKQILTPENTLRGYYQWVRENIVPIKDKLNPNYRYIGEWMVKHKIEYKDENVKQFFLFSIWDDTQEKYLSDEIVIKEAERLGLQTVEYFYRGEFVSFEHLMSFVGKSNTTLEPNTGEGIVVKNVNYVGRDGKQLFVKLVSDSFSEVQKQKKPKNPNVNSEKIEQVKSVLTKARVDKLMHKLIDEDFITRDDFVIEKMGTLIKLLLPRVLEDVIKEESDLINLEDHELKLFISKILPLIIKDVLKEY